MSNNIRTVHIRTKGTKPTKLTLVIDNKPRLITLSEMTKTKEEILEDLSLEINELRLKVELLNRNENTDKKTIRNLNNEIIECMKEFICIALNPIPKNYVKNMYDEDISTLLEMAICYMKRRTLDDLEDFLKENKKLQKEFEEEKKTGN